MLHVKNSFELPVHLLKSYSLYAGVQDALVQWWYGHNAVAFFCTIIGFDGPLPAKGSESPGLLLPSFLSFTFGLLFSFTSGLDLTTYFTLHCQTGLSRSELYSLLC